MRWNVQFFGTWHRCRNLPQTVTPPRWLTLHPSSDTLAPIYHGRAARLCWSDNEGTPMKHVCISPSFKPPTMTRVPTRFLFLVRPQLLTRRLSSLLNNSCIRRSR
jgi:hypothetical protein